MTNAELLDALADIEETMQRRSDDLTASAAKLTADAASVQAQADAIAALIVSLTP